ncbi:glutaredoxin family protein [Sulfurirhabdus autotrophica]|uniref:Glutaredoxin n=1 Tax=Sulfurirhabdus autotrophica TaxID=1706046 RepID=A0A4R3Y4N9_9PROT|nr:glutaredoxin family protein [Sulfurirhabdus autotrophica]TCV86371.1 glutaredoxin [Sulfurirhabdus autotrophica]
MKSRLLSGLLLCLCTSMVIAGNFYRWVDAEGKVHYTDEPPPASAKSVQEKKLSGNVIEMDKSSYATQVAVKRFPVVLYTSDCGAGCNKARELLVNRGVPYTTKNITTAAEGEALKKLVGALEVPVLVVGSSATIKGFEAGAWNAALDDAGYPKASASRLPATPKTTAAEKKAEVKPAPAAK